MVTHLYRRNNKSLCGRDRFFGANRRNEIFMVNVKDFIATYKRDKNSVCQNCLHEYNKIAKNNGGKK